MNRITKITEPTATNYLENSYDASGRRTNLKVTYNTNTVWNYNYSYDSSGKPKQFTDTSTNNKSWYLFDEADRLLKNSYTNDTASYYSYDQEGRIKDLRIEKTGETNEKFRYEYDSNGNITKME